MNDIQAHKHEPASYPRASSLIETNEKFVKKSVSAKKEVEARMVTPARKDREPISGATRSLSATSSSSTAPLRIEPKIIETPSSEVIRERIDGELFTRDELSTFRDLLYEERGKILAKARRAVEEGNIAIDRNELMDEVDQASVMVEQNLVFRLLDRDRKLLTEIDHALGKLDSGDYGYCEGTGEPIPKRRLELRPWCRHSVKYKEKLERMKKSGRGVVDEDEV